MSGIDEVLREIPICPVCGGRPDYWTIRGTRGIPVLWLFSEKYRKKYSENYGGSVQQCGEVRLEELRAVNYKLANACCMGIGCHAEFEVLEYPKLFNAFYSLFDNWFPNKLTRTD